MARMNVNPTRMELKKLKARLKTAERGHKLLKDKTDEMVRRFTSIIKENKRYRDDVEKDVSRVLKQFSVARSVISRARIELAFSMPAVSVDLDCEKGNVMSVAVPKLTFNEKKAKDIYPYSFSDLTSEADYAVEMVGAVIKKLVRLAEIEKSTMMLADEIEKGKRRVNALENIMIPNLKETISYITMKLEENDRNSRTRLMKVKSMLEERENTGSPV
ncbi:MAG: V-type ATP synthase subunit D [Clostridiales bacterium]|nr:V-type ATP synthase subunit D [Clostridiales bacterium]